VRFLEKSKDKWKAQARDLEAENARLQAQLDQMREHGQGQAGKKSL